MLLYSKTQILILKACGVVIAVGCSILAIDRWFVRGDEPPPEHQLAAVIDDLELEVVQDQFGLRRLTSGLAPFESLLGKISGIDVVLRRSEAAGSLWLVQFRSRQRSALLDRMVSPTGVETPRFLILVELANDPGWPAFLQQAPSDVPDVLPEDWHARLASLQPYRMGIHAQWVAFVAQVSGPSLLQSMQSHTSAEFHPGLLSSAMRIDVQQALDIVGAMHGAPVFEPFYLARGIESNLPQTDTSALQRMAIERQARQDAFDEQREKLRKEQAVAREALRLKQAETIERFRSRTETVLDPLNEKDDHGGANPEAAIKAQPTLPDTEQAIP